MAQKLIQSLCLLLCLTWGISAKNASANDEGLYDPLPPAGSAFVRFIAHPDYTGDMNVTLNEKSYALSPKGAFSDYYIVPKGDVSLQAGLADFSVEEGALYSVFLLSSGAKILQDPGHENMKKAQIIAYNFSLHPKISIKTTNGKIDIIKDIHINQVNMRAINPVKIDTALFTSTQKIIDLPNLSMERGHSYSIAVFNNGKDVIWTENKTDTSK